MFGQLTSVQPPLTEYLLMPIAQTNTGLRPRLLNYFIIVCNDIKINGLQLRGQVDGTSLVSISQLRQCVQGTCNSTKHFVLKEYVDTMNSNFKYDTKITFVHIYYVNTKQINCVFYAFITITFSLHVGREARVLPTAQTMTSRAYVMTKPSN